MLVSDPTVATDQDSSITSCAATATKKVTLECAPFVLTPRKHSSAPVPTPDPTIVAKPGSSTTSLATTTSTFTSKDAPFTSASSLKRDSAPVPTPDLTVATTQDSCNLHADPANKANNTKGNPSQPILKRGKGAQTPHGGARTSPSTPPSHHEKEHEAKEKRSDLSSRGEWRLCLGSTCPGVLMAAFIAALVAALAVLVLGFGAAPLSYSFASPTPSLAVNEQQQQPPAYTPTLADLSVPSILENCQAEVSEGEGRVVRPTAR